MNAHEIAAKNMLLGIEFDKYVLEHPSLAARIPEGALIVFLPEYDPELCEENLKLAQRHRQPEQPVLYVKISKLAPIPKSRIRKPKIEIAT